MPIEWLARGAEQLDHPPGAGADIDQPPDRPAAERLVDRLFDLAFGDVERADLVPHLGVAGEIAVGGLGALGADGLGARRVGGEQPLRRRVGPAVDEVEHWRDALAFAERQEHPASLLAPLEHAGIGEDLQMPRNTRLALAENLRQLAHRQLHQPQQRDDPQAGRIGKRLDSIGERKNDVHQITI